VTIRIKVRRRRVKKWLAAGTLVAYSAAGTSKLALAQQSTGAGQSAPAQGQVLAVIRFEIPEGSLEDALRAYSSLTGLHVAAQEPGIWKIHCAGVSGLYTPQMALKILLANTGVAARIGAAGEILLALSKVVQNVEVTGHVEPLAQSSPKFGETLEDMPQTIVAIPPETLAQQGVTTLRDALRNAPGISLAAGEGGAQGDSLTIRGFTARNDLYVDGMRDFGSYYRDPFNTSEVEVLEGPSSIAFGRGSTGGVVNQSTKSPALKPLFSGEADFGSDLTRRVAADLDTPLPKLATGAAFRLNVMGDEANIAGRNVAEDRRYGVAPSLSFGLGTATRLTLSYFHQSGDDIPDYGVPWLFNGPAPVNRSNYYGFRHGSYLRTGDDIGTVRFERDFNARISLRNQARYANYARDARITEAQILGSPTLATPLSSIQINRNQITVNSVESFLDDQLDLTVKARTGFLEHSVVTGIEMSRETSDPTRFTWANVPTTSLLNPNPDQPFSGTAAISSRVQTTALTQAAYAMDRIRLSKKWELTGGLRWDRFDADYAQTAGTPSAFRRVDDMPSWRAALVFKPVAPATLYATAGTSFNPSAESLSLSAANANLPPEKNRSYELGAKWELPRQRLSLATALFQTTKMNAREPDPANSLLNVLAGTQRVNGFTAEARGRLTSRWEALAGYAYLDAKLVSSNFYPAAVGAQLANVPRNTFNLWTNYRLPGRWSLGAGGNYVSARTASSTAPFDPITGLVKKAPGYWVFNAMLSRRLTEHVDLQANAYNLANRYYYDQLHPAHIVPGPGRSVLIGLKFKF
jgi:catecholate siderophore receptor